jgi:hypothetical protein
LPELPRRIDVLPDQRTAPMPSLWLYLALVLLSGSMLAFALRSGVGAPDVLVNLGTGLLETVAILVLIDRRLRQSELSSIKSLPRNVGLLIFLMRPTERQLYRYARRFLMELQRKVRDFDPRPELSQHQSKVDQGFVLLGKRGVGKTTWLQSVAIDKSAAFLKDPTTNRAIVLLPVSSWLPDRTLEEALVEHLSGFSRMTIRAFRRAMRRARLTIILDGADEASRLLSPALGEQLKALRLKYPRVAWVVSASSEYPTPTDLQPVVNVSPPSDEEIAEFARRMNR